MPIQSERPPVEVANEPFGDILLRALWQHSLKAPNQPALINAENPAERVTYRELYVHSHSVAGFLADRRFGHRDVACIVMPNCWQFAAIFGGVALRGGTLSGASYLFSEHELRRQFVDSKSKVIFCSDDVLDRVMKAVPKYPMTVVVVRQTRSSVKQHFDVVDFDQVLRREPSFQNAKPGVDVAKDVLYLPYSSGTTGHPKGVMLSHRNWGTMVRSFASHWNRDIMPSIDPKWTWPTENVLQAMPFFHDYGFSMLCTGLLVGSTGVCIRKFEPDTYCRAIQDYKGRAVSRSVLEPPFREAGAGP
ncbi:Protein ACS-14 [Aphelenchoides avenae]|nr:Protein ACS-14 [Aphelenchus avenae]